MKAAALVVAVAMFAACVANGTPSSAGDQGGYLYRNGAEVLFVRLDRAGAAPHGTVDWYHGKGQRISADFILRTSEGGFSLEFPAGSLAGWTGTFTGDGLSLVVPAENGGLRTLALMPASVEAFDAAVAELR